MKMSVVVDHNVIKQTYYCTASTGMRAERHSSSASFFSLFFFFLEPTAALHLVQLG